MAENEVKINDIPVATFASFTDNDLFLIVDDGEARLLRRSTFQAWMLENVQGATGGTGAQGLQGVAGEDGTDAAQATNIVIQDDHSVIVTYNNSTTLQSNTPPRILGWGSYKDGQYTDALPFTISANTTVIIPNNSGSIISNGMPINVTTFYDSTTQKCLMTDINGLYAVRVKFKVAASNNADHIQIVFSKNTTENPYIEDRTLRGDDLIQDMNFITFVYGDTPLSSNGMTISLKTYSRAVSIYNIEFTISKIN